MGITKDVRPVSTILKLRLSNDNVEVKEAIEVGGACDRGVKGRKFVFKSAKGGKVKQTKS